MSGAFLSSRDGEALFYRYAYLWCCWVRLAFGLALVGGTWAWGAHMGSWSCSWAWPCEPRVLCIECLVCEPLWLCIASLVCDTGKFLEYKHVIKKNVIKERCPRCMESMPAHRRDRARGRAAASAHLARVETTVATHTTASTAPSSPTPSRACT